MARGDQPARAGDAAGGSRGAASRGIGRLRGIVAARSWRGAVDVAGGARIGRGVRIEVARGGYLRVGRGCRVGDGCRLVVCSGGIELGVGSVLGEQCTLIARREITIGEGCRVADGVSILDFGPAPSDSERPIRLQPLHEEAVVLGRDVVVGLRATLGPGVRLAAAARVEPGVALGDLAEPLLDLADPAPPPAAAKRPGRVAVGKGTAEVAIADGATATGEAGA